MALPPWQCSCTSTISQTDVVMEIKKADLQGSLEESLVRHRVAGASVAVFHESELITAAAGVINVNTGVEFTTDTLTLLGSITKVFTTTLVMQLVDEGIVDLDERVVRYLPDLRLKSREALEQITVKMLLNHTAGINGDMLPDHGHDEETIEKGIARFAQFGQLFCPGADFSYSNGGMVIAGYLAQRLRGKSWYRLIRERIFEPLEMEHSATLPEEALLHRASVGHYLEPESKKVVRTSVVFFPLSFSPCGTSLMTSAPDLIAFARAHMGNGMEVNGARILSERSAKAMQRTTVNITGRGYTYIDMGLGWMVSGDGLLHHLGGNPGVRSALYAYPAHGFAAAILTNAAHSFGLMNELMEPWLKEFGAQKPVGMVDIHFPSQPEKIDPNKYVGVYEDVSSRFSVSPTADGLALSRQAKVAHSETAPTE